MSERPAVYDVSGGGPVAVASPTARPVQGRVRSAVGELLVGLCRRLGLDPATATVAELVERVEADGTGGVR